MEDQEFGINWAEAAWDRCEKLLKGHNDGTAILSPGHYNQYIEISPYLSCHLDHLTLDQVKERFPNLSQILDVEYIIYRKPKITSVHRLVARKPAN